jgi:hypothetical protein
MPCGGGETGDAARIDFPEGKDDPAVSLCPAGQLLVQLPGWLTSG